MSPRVLYSFPHKIGDGRICWTAFQQVTEVARAGAQLTVLSGSVLPGVQVPGTLRTTLGVGKLRLPYRVFGTRRSCMIHDWLTAKWLERNYAKVDIVHAWPLGALATIRIARRHRIPVLLERPNAHTAFAYQAVEDECTRIGITLPKGFEHKFDQRTLDRELMEYDSADYLLCPSEFVAKTFVERGVAPQKLLRHHYGFDEKKFVPSQAPANETRGLTVMYAGLCTPRKGLHLALEAWMKSGVWKTGRLIVCGTFVDGYAELLAPLLKHPSVQVMGHRRDLNELMCQADVFVLPSIEEGSALVTYEARGAGCVLVVSSAAGAVCEHGVNALVHEPGNVVQIANQLSQLDQDRAFLQRLRKASMAGTSELSWRSAGERLFTTYQRVIKQAVVQNEDRAI